MNRRAYFIRELVIWLNTRLAPPGALIGADTPLFAAGMIDSIAILKLIAWTERATGRLIPDHQIRLDNFNTPRRIAEVFVTEGAEP